MAFVITRVDDTLFDFQLDGGDIRTDDKPRLTTFNNLCDFKTANGANLYQRIALNTIMVVDTFGGSGTFTFTTILELRQKLKELKFFEGANGDGAGSGVDRFDNLLDAFQYFENAGKVAIVNPNETALIASEFHNINRSTQLVDFPSTLIAGKWLQVANDGLSFTFIDPIEQPEPYVNAVGWVIYDNNEASPISYVSGLEQLTNDTAGIDTNVDNLPFGVSNLWDNGLNELDFSQLSLNDMVDLSLNTTVTTNSINQNCKIYLKVAIGSASEKTILLNDLTFATVDTYDILSRLNLAIINSDYKDFPAQILFESNDTADVYLENIYISTTRKDANYAILDAVDSTASHNKGNYNITTNTPTLSNGSGQIGDYYTLTTAGTRDFGAGNITFGIGDRIEYNGGVWFKAIDNSQGMGALDNTADHDKGDYNATTNTPTLIDGTGQIGDYYKVTVAGTVDLGSGNIILQVDDIIGYDGSIWYKKVNNNQSGGGVTSIDTLSGVQTLGGITTSLSEKVTIVDDDLIGGADSEATNASKKWKFSTIATYVLSKLGAYLFALTAKTTPVDADTITINDTEASNVLKKLSLTNFWLNYIKPKTDLLYVKSEFIELQQDLATRITNTSDMNTWKGYDANTGNMFTNSLNTSYGTATDPSFTVNSTTAKIRMKNITSLHQFLFLSSYADLVEFQFQVWLYDFDDTEVSPVNKYKNPRKIVDQSFTTTAFTPVFNNFTISSHTLTTDSVFLVFMRAKNTTVTPAGFTHSPTIKWIFKK